MIITRKEECIPLQVVFVLMYIVKVRSKLCEEMSDGVSSSMKRSANIQYQDAKQPAMLNWVGIMHKHRESSVHGFIFELALPLNRQKLGTEITFILC